LASRTNEKSTDDPPFIPDSAEEDYYSLLGVTFSASHAEITRAYRAAMKRVHPDRQPISRRARAEVYARLLNEAYRVLSDPLKRQAYDRTIQQQVIQDQIMRRYVGGFETREAMSGPEMPRREPTELERRERLDADRRAWTLLIGVAVAVAALIIAAVIIGSILNAIFNGLT
jgi:curved DNA-binding protein CbpA